MNLKVVQVARSWIGTPYVHQASSRGHGCDCLGLLRGVWRETIGAEPFVVPPYTPDWAEPQAQELLWQAAKTFLKPVLRTHISAGDVLLFRMRRQSVAKHLGIATGVNPATFIHAYAGHGVVESPLSEPWRNRVVAHFTFH